MRCRRWEEDDCFATIDFFHRRMYDLLIGHHCITVNKTSLYYISERLVPRTLFLCIEFRHQQLLERFYV